MSAYLKDRKAVLLQNDLEPADFLIVSHFLCWVASAPSPLWLFRKMQITSRKEMDKNKRTSSEKIRMFSRCAVYLHKAFYLGHLLVSNFVFPHSRSCCKHFSGKTQVSWAVVLTMEREGGGKASWSSFRMTQLLFFFYIRSVSISNGEEVPAELSGQLSGRTETSRLWIHLWAAGVGHFEFCPFICGRFVWQMKIEAQKRSWKLFRALFDVRNCVRKCFKFHSQCELTLSKMQ